MRKTVASILGALALAGCYTTPISTHEASLVPSERVTDAGRKLMQTTPATGQVIVKRDSGFTGAGCATRIYVDGVAVADINPAEKFVIHLSEGDHMISAEPTGICGGVMTEVRAPVRKGVSSAFRYGASGNGTPMIAPTAF